MQLRCSADRHRRASRGLAQVMDQRSGVDPQQHRLAPAGSSSRRACLALLCRLALEPDSCVRRTQLALPRAGVDRSRCTPRSPAIAMSFSSALEPTRRPAPGWRCDCTGDAAPGCGRCAAASMPGAMPACRSNAATRAPRSDAASWGGCGRRLEPAASRGSRWPAHGNGATVTGPHGALLAKTASRTGGGSPRV